MIILRQFTGCRKRDARGKAKLRTGQLKKRLSPTAQIPTVGEDIGHEAIVSIFAVCTLRKESSAMPSVVTQQFHLFAKPVASELLGARVDDEATST